MVGCGTTFWLPRDPGCQTDRDFTLRSLRRTLSASMIPSGITSTFSENGNRLLDAHVAARFQVAMLRHPKIKRSDPPYATLIEAWVSMKSMRAKDRSGAAFSRSRGAYC